MKRASGSRLVLIVILILFLGLDRISRTAAPAYAADATLVFEAYRAILTNYFQRKDPVSLLTSALQGLRRALTSTGIAEPLGDLAAADAATAESDFQARFDRASSLVKGKLTATQLQYAAASAMVRSLSDDSSSFYTPELWTPEETGRFVGVPIVLRHWFGRWVVFSTTEQTQEATGLHPFDRIIAIDGQSTENMTYNDLNRLIGAGESSERLAGTTVMLTVIRPGQTMPLTIPIVLQVANRRVHEGHRMLAGNVGYIWIRSLRASGDAAQFRRSVFELKQEGMRGLILDLRSNSGNTEDEFVQGFLVANALLRAGARVQMVAVHIEDLQAQPQPCPAALHNQPVNSKEGTILVSRLPSPCVFITSGGALLDPSTPLVVVVSGDTGAANVFLSAAIQDARRGKLVGERTYGSSAWVNYVVLPGGARMGLKTHVVATGRGTVLTPKAGIPPDVAVAMAETDIDRGVDTQLMRAVEELSR